MQVLDIPDEERPVINCQRCGGFGLVESPDHPGKTIPCPVCFPVRSHIGELLKRLSKRRK